MAKVSIQDFEGWSVAELTTFREALITSATALLVRGSSYSIAGRSFSFATLTEIKDTIAAIGYSLGKLTGTRSDHVRANFNPSVGRNP